MLKVKAIRTRSCTTPDLSLSLNNGSLAATGAESQGIENNSPNSVSDLVAVYKGKQLRVRLTSHPQPDSGFTSDSSDSSVSIAPRGRRRGRVPNPSKRRGDGPKGDWRARALKVDWTSPASIDKYIPNYAGARFGKEPFPMYRLLTGNWGK